MSVVVVGSANVDLVSRVSRIPSPGETVLSHAFSTHAGGKGANQATAAARAGAATAFVVALGDDGDGRMLESGLVDDGVAVKAQRSGVPTGTALIAVSDDGENAIVVNAGANAQLRLDDDDRELLRAADVVLAQLEVPLTTVIDAALAAEAGGALVMLNAAPAVSLPDRLLSAVDILVVNEHEAALLAGVADTGAQADPGGLATALLGRVPAVVVTLGASGALVGVGGTGTADRPILTAVPARPVEVADTTGAGDTFCGVLAAELDRHRSEADPRSPEQFSVVLTDAVRIATTAASIAVQRAGAVPSIPTREEIDRAV